MRCSEFCDQHCAFIDDTLPGVELVRMQRHVNECSKCAAHDAKVRRSLMMARSLLPAVELSPDFSRRLEERIQACRSECGRADYSNVSNFRTFAAVGAVASALMLGYMAESLQMPQAGGAQDLVLPPVVAMAELEQPQIAGQLADAPAPAIVASMSTGMPLWPVAVFAEQAPLHYASHK